jgi:hypothetical protein
MKQQLFALSLGFAGLILATQHAFAQHAPHGIGLVASGKCLESRAASLPVTGHGT